MLVREAAKIAVEYIALIASPDVALLPQLDAVRNCAITGIVLEGGSAGPIGPSRVWLPRMKRIRYCSRRNLAALARVPPQDWFG